MDHDEQVRTIGRLLELEQQVDSLQADIATLRRKRYLDPVSETDIAKFGNDVVGGKRLQPAQEPVRPVEPEKPAELKRTEVKRKLPNAWGESRAGNIAVATLFIAMLLFICFLVALGVRAHTLSVSISAPGPTRAAIVFIVLFAVAVVICVMFWKQADKQAKVIEQTPEFQARLAEANKEYDRQQAEMDAQLEGQKRQLAEQYDAAIAQYRADCEAYDEAVFKSMEDQSAFEEAEAEWMRKRDAKVSEMGESLNQFYSELQALYSSSMLVPQQFRTIDALQAIYQTISTSNYDVHAAIDVYERGLQRDLEHRRLREQQLANEQAAEQNALLEEQNRIANRARLEANAAAAVSTLQSHKHASELSKKLDEIKRSQR